MLRKSEGVLKQNEETCRGHLRGNKEEKGKGNLKETLGNNEETCRGHLRGNKEEKRQRTSKGNCRQLDEGLGEKLKES